MNLLTDFYKELDPLNLIIFWGIIIVIVLVIILIVILICKNKKQKKTEKNNYDNEMFEEIPIKKETIDTLQKSENKQEKISPTIPMSEENKASEEPINGLSNIEENKVMFQEENTPVDNQEKDILSNIENDNNINKLTKQNNEKMNSSPIEIPTKPYQRNVLREMSLSQTSPIGISRPTPKEDQKIAMEKDLEDALNNEELNNNQVTIDYPKSIANASNQIDSEIKKDLFNIQNDSYRKTEIKKEISTNLDKTNNEQPKTISRFDQAPRLSDSQFKNTDIIEKINKLKDNESEAMKYFTNASNLNNEDSNLDAKELLINNATIEDEQTKTETESYLEEVSRKLSNAETPNEIERTTYEIKQEEDAIISYKELMEKKDSIQTIDEEDAVISIEELMNKTSQKHEDYQEKSKLYNISEEEENDDFLKELKQFRSDL